MKNFKGLNNIRYYLYRSLIYIGLIVTVVSLIIGYDESIERIVGLITFGFFWLTPISILPLLILFFNYSKENKTSSLIIDNGNFEFSKNKQITKFTLSDIEEIELNISPNLFYNGLTFFLWDEYYYTLVKLKNGDNLIITCLLCNELETHIPNELIKRKRRLLPTTFNF